MGVGGIGWIERLETRVTVRRGQEAAAEMLRALAKELALQLGRKLVWGKCWLCWGSQARRRKESQGLMENYCGFTHILIKYEVP